MEMSNYMFSEASSAPRVVSEQLRNNRGQIDDLAARLRGMDLGLLATCARGSSDSAATFAKYLIETSLRIPVTSAAPSISSVYGSQTRLDKAGWLAISQSGQSPDLLAATERAKAAGAFTIGLVNDPSSPLARLVDESIDVGAGIERSVAATKSYIASLTSIVDLVASWSGDAELAEALALTPDKLERAWQLDWQRLVDSLVTARSMFVAGRGVGLAIAQEAALKLKEICGVHAEAFSGAELVHGPLALVEPGFAVLVFRQADESAPLNDRLVEGLRDRGAAVFVAGSEASGAAHLPSIEAHPAIEPILQVQTFYRAANLLAAARGIDPDKPPQLEKVTRTT